MPRTAELKLRIDPKLKAEATELYGRWGINLTDAVTIFLNQSVATGGLPFPMRQLTKPEFDWNNPAIIRKEPGAAHPVLPADWDIEDDSIYDKL
jgi:DNA-damage-inducible protein J